MSLYRATAIVVRTFKVAEADRIAVLVTLEHGKVRAVVKGVRKTTARHGLRLEPLEVQVAARQALDHQGEDTLDVGEANARAGHARQSGATHGKSRSTISETSSSSSTPRTR